MEKKYTLKVKMIVLGIGILLAFILGEVLLRVTNIDEEGFKLIKMKQEYFKVTKTNNFWGTTYVPNVNTYLDQSGRNEKLIMRFTTVPIPGFEQYGMRDDGINISAKEKIVVLGDSFTWGATINREDIWCEKIEDRNNEVDMINLGQSAGVLQAATMYKTIEEKLPEHKTVIYALWLGNEFLDNYAFKSVKLEELEETENNLHRQRWYYPLIINSKMLYILYKMYYITNIPVKKFFDYVPEGTLYDDAVFGDFNLNPKNQFGVRYAEVNNNDTVYIEGIEATKKGIQELKEITQKKGRELIIVVLPFKEQVYYERIKDKITFENDILQPNKQVATICKKEKIRCIDITEDLKKENKEKLYWKDDVHFTPLGQEKTAIIVEKELKTAGVL